MNCAVIIIPSFSFLLKAVANQQRSLLLYFLPPGQAESIYVGRVKIQEFGFGPVKRGLLCSFYLFGLSCLFSSEDLVCFFEGFGGPVAFGLQFL